MGIHKIVWIAAIAGILAATAACGSKTTEPSSILGPSQEFLRTALFSLSGTVLTASDDGTVPVEGARVEISGEDVFEAYTDAQGRYSFSRLERATWRLLVQKDGYADAITDVELNGTTTIDVVLEPMDR